MKTLPEDSEEDSVVVLFSFCLFEWNTSRNARLTVEKQISNDGDAINKKKEA